MPWGEESHEFIGINSAQLLCIVLYDRIEMACYLSWFFLWVYVCVCAQNVHCEVIFNFCVCVCVRTKNVHCEVIFLNFLKVFSLLLLDLVYELPDQSLTLLADKGFTTLNVWPYQPQS